MAEDVKSVSEGLPKWQIALAIGTPTVLGLAGIWYWRRRNKSVPPEKPVVTEKPVVEVVKEEDEKPLTPAEQAQSFKSKGNKYFKGEKFDKAIECYTEAISICPPDKKSDIATFYQNRAAANDKLKKTDEVISDCTEALKYNDRYTKALSRRAKAYESKGGIHFLKALEDITATCILESFANPTSLEMAERVLTEAAKVSAHERYEKRVPCYPSAYFISSYFTAFANDPAFATKHQSSESGDESLDEKYTEETPEKEINQINTESAVKVQSSPYQEAISDLQAKRYKNILSLSAKEIDAEGAQFAAEARLLRASMYLLRGESQRAMQDFDQLLKMNGISKSVRCNALIKRGSLMMQEGNDAAALSDFAAAVTEDPDNSDIYHHRGQMNLLVNRIDDAVRDFDRSVQLNPDFAIAHVQKIYTEYRQAQMLQSPLQLAQSMKNFEKAISKFPDCSEGYALYAQALSDQQQFGEADNNFKKAVELEQANGNNYVHRGLLRLQWKQDIDEATQFIETALKVDDKCGFAYETLGTIEVQRGNLDKAILLFEKALDVARTELEFTVLYKMFHAALAQKNVAKNMGILAPNLR